MKQKTATFIVGFLVYGFLFGGAMYFFETDRNLWISIKSAIFFGLFMSLFELFVMPKTKKFFSKNKID